MQKEKKSTEALKHYLRGAKYWREKADYLSCKIMALRSKAEKTTTSFSDTPTFGSYEDHRQVVITEIIEKQKQYRSAVDNCNNRLQEIQLFIDNLQNYEERIACEMHYIYFEEWQDVAIRLHYSLRQIHNIHGSALLNLLEIHKKMIENGGKKLF